MNIDEKDLKLSEEYHKAVLKAHEQISNNILDYKSNICNKIEVKLFLENKNIIKGLTLNKKDKYDIIYTFIVNNFSLNNNEIRKIMFLKGYFNTENKVFIYSLLVFLISFTIGLIFGNHLNIVIQVLLVYIVIISFLLFFIFFSISLIAFKND